MDDKTVNKVLLDVQKEYARSNKIKDKIIVLLIVLMFAEAVVGYSGFVYYESQFETTTTEKIIEMHYKQGKSLGYIADILGMSESSVKNKHRKLLIKIGNIM